jgi:hypothetical protein
VIAGLTVFVVLLTIQGFLRVTFREFAGTQCVEVVSVEIPSPDRQHKIDLIDQHCVDGPGQSVHVILLGARQIFDINTQSGLPVTNLSRVSPEQVSVRWTNPQQVLITYPKSNDPRYATPHLMEMNLSGIDIQIRSLP